MHSQQAQVTPQREQQQSERASRRQARDDARLFKEQARVAGAAAEAERSRRRMQTARASLDASITALEQLQGQAVTAAGPASALAKTVVNQAERAHSLQLAAFQAAVDGGLAAAAAAVLEGLPPAMVVGYLDAALQHAEAAESTAGHALHCKAVALKACRLAEMAPTAAAARRAAADAAEAGSFAALDIPSGQQRVVILELAPRTCGVTGRMMQVLLPTKAQLDRLGQGGGGMVRRGCVAGCLQLPLRSSGGGGGGGGGGGSQAVPGAAPGHELYQAVADGLAVALKRSLLPAEVQEVHNCTMCPSELHQRAREQMQAEALVGSICARGCVHLADVFSFGLLVSGEQLDHMLPPAQPRGPEGGAPTTEQLQAWQRQMGEWCDMVEQAVQGRGSGAQLPFCVVQGYFPLGDLHSFMAASQQLPLPAEEARIASNDVALAVQHMHAYGRVHRDLKDSK